MFKLIFDLAACKDGMYFGIYLLELSDLDF